jgi:hypothetical protein
VLAPHGLELSQAREQFLAAVTREPTTHDGQQMG